MPSLSLTPSTVKELPRPLSIPFYVKRFPRIIGLWEGTKAPDYAFRDTIPAKGETSETGAFARNAGLHMIRRGGKDLALAKTFYRVQTCLEPQTDLTSPVILGKVAWNWLTS
ncbi:hypothetical protein FRB94_005871 [Tulasnella sp. JGI-2019a]|nr:hypothetical protein FRB94_005871 [Tulasnella sp. JGI-2019a]